MRRAFIAAFAFLATGTIAAGTLVFFPGELDSDQADRYAPLERGFAEWLGRLQEPSLCCKTVVSKPTFRFTWVRTFHRPVSLRLEQKADGTWLLHTRIVGGAGGYEWGTVSTDETSVVPTAKAKALAARLAPGTSFWSLPVRDDRFGTDGATWIIEARCGDAYHYVYRWSPEEGDVRAIGLTFIALSNLRDEEVY